MKTRVLVVDDDPERGALVTRALASTYDCLSVATLDEAFASVGRGAWEAALVDYNLSREGSGLELLQALREFSPHTYRVLYSIYYSDALIRDASRLASVHAVVDARKEGFFVTMKEALDKLMNSGDYGAVPAPAPTGRQRGLLWVGGCPTTVDFLTRLRRAAASDSPVFIYGERGSGKSLAADLFRAWRMEWKASGKPSTEHASPVTLLAVPPVRDRLEDVPLLAQHVLRLHAVENREAVRYLTNEALDELMRRDWWGNVRELHGVLVRGCQRAGQRLGLSAADLPKDVEPHSRPSQHAKDEGQRECVLRQLRTAGNVSGAARLEGISRTNYIRLMRRLGIVRADTGAASEIDLAQPIESEENPAQA